MKSDATKQGQGGTVADAGESEIASQVEKLDWQSIARLVLLSRAIDSVEETQLAPAGETKLQLSSAGHELAQIILGVALDHPCDAVTAYYRSRPLLLASGMTCHEAIAASLASAEGPSGGRDVGVVFNLPRREKATILPASGNVGAQFTPAAGWAQALRYRTEILGEEVCRGAVAVATGGDGSVATNGFWSALTIGTTLNLPLLFFIEDNGYAISVPSTLQTPGGNIASNLAAFQNLKIIEASGSDPLETAKAVFRALQHLRCGKGPCLLRLALPRLSGHAFTDKQVYKAKEQLDADRMQDPLPQLKKFLLAQNVLSGADFASLEYDVFGEVNEALERVRGCAADPQLDPRQHLFFQRAPLQGGLRAAKALPQLGALDPDESGEELDLRQSIQRTLEREMQKNKRILVFGEDVGLYGGIHGVTRSLQESLGSNRVFDTSLSEEGIVGRSIGMAIAGLMPGPELQFRKYADAGYEQMVDAGLVRWRTDGKFASPMVVRIPVGCGKKGGDPWHSMCGEASYAHLLGWQIAMPSNAMDAVGLLRAALRGDDPTLFLEHRGLLVDERAHRNYPGDDYCLPFGKAGLCLDGDGLTIVSWGEMVYRCLEAASAFPGAVSVIDLRTLIPWDQESVLQSVRKTGKLLVVHEDTVTGGFAGEILATITSEAYDALQSAPQRLCTADCPIPYDVAQMKRVVPSVEQIQFAIERFLSP
ncbi:MAG: thiamine pyrophosphate-dependent enzyme [Planctomycetota bacterium]|nr:thiamine pyrophosphate-dependent enzyme [Planctomycetota bacterium]